MNARTTAVGLRRATPWRAKCAARRIIDDGALTGHTGLERDTVVRQYAPDVRERLGLLQVLTSYDAKQAAANKALETPGAAKAAMETAFKNLKARRGPILGVRAHRHCRAASIGCSRRQQALPPNLAAANFNFEKLSKAQIASFEASSKIMEGASNKITAYDKNVCGVKD